MTEPNANTLATRKYRAKAAVLRKAYLADKTCCDCGRSGGLWIVWKDKPGPVSTSKIWHRSPEGTAALLELTKVQCTSCRNKETGRRLARVEHGGGSQGIWKCKCDLCKAAKSRYNSEWETRKRERGKALKALPKGKVQ